MAKKKNMSALTSLGYITKVGKNLEGIVGQQFALAYSSIAQGRWNENMGKILDVGNSVYLAIGKILSDNPMLTDETGGIKYRGYGVSMSAEAYKIYKRKGRIMESDLDLLANLYSQSFGIPKSKAMEIAKVIKSAYNREPQEMY